MMQAFVIMLREGFEMFLIISIISSYLKRIGQNWLLPFVGWGILVSVGASVGLGFIIYQGVNTPLWEGIMGVVAAVLVASLVIHMWIEAASIKKKVEQKLDVLSSKPSRFFAATGVLLFNVFMISREGMETALMLIQVPEGRIFSGVALGLLATVIYCYLWLRFSQYINIKLFFQVTGIFLLLFVVQILIYAFHEFTEAGLFPNAEAWHVATEPFSPSGIYGQWFSIVSVGICAGWLVWAWLRQKLAANSSR
jgi:high-affinity iron transporter